MAYSIFYMHQCKYQILLCSFFLCVLINIKAQVVKPFTLLHGPATGISFQNTLVESAELNIITYEYYYNGGGVATADFNNDGLTDIYISGNMVPNKLYLNKGNLKFADISKVSGAEGRRGWKTGVSVADVNGDGWLDIYVCYSFIYKKLVTPFIFI